MLALSRRCVIELVVAFGLGLSAINKQCQSIVYEYMLLSYIQSIAQYVTMKQSIVWVRRNPHHPHTV